MQPRHVSMRLGCILFINTLFSMLLSILSNPYHVLAKFLQNILVECIGIDSVGLRGWVYYAGVLENYGSPLHYWRKMVTILWGAMPHYVKCNVQKAICIMHCIQRPMQNILYYFSIKKYSLQNIASCIICYASCISSN